MPCEEGCLICDPVFRHKVFTLAKAGAVCTLSVVASVCLTLTNNALMRGGAVHPTGLVLAHSLASLLSKWRVTAGGLRPSAVAGVTATGWALLALLSLGGYVQVALWNLGIARGASMADFQLFKLTSPLWSAAVASALLDARLSGVGWLACAASGAGLALGAGVGPGADFGKAVENRFFLAAAALQPMTPMLMNSVNKDQGLHLRHGAWLWANVIEVAIAAALLDAPRAALARLDRRAALLLALSSALAVVLRWTTAKVSTFDGGPVLYAILSPVKAVLALLVAAALVPRDRSTLDAPKVAGLVVCAASATAFVVKGKKMKADAAPGKKAQ
jgi:hypothetical protein